MKKKQEISVEMKPSYTKVECCRACGSENIADLEINKSYYLLNLDQTVQLSYAVCVDCQFIFHGEFVGEEYLEHYYKQSPMLRREELTKFVVDQNERQSAFLLKNMPLGGQKVLEIGAHVGAFLVHLNKHHGCKSYFNELSEEAVKVLSAQDGLLNYQSIDPDVKMDLVILRHVLEHIFDLEGFLQFVKSIVSDDGYLFVEVPDWSWFDSNTDPLIFEHVNQFNTSNLINLLRKMGWQTEAVEKSIVADDPATPNRVQRILARPINKPNPKDATIVQIFQVFHEETFGGANRAINSLISRMDKNKTVALYPASHLTFAALSESNLSDANIIGMFDIDEKKHGRIVQGIEVFPAAKLTDKKPDLILLFTMGYEREIRESFIEMGLESEVVSIAELLNQGEGNKK